MEQDHRVLLIGLRGVLAKIIATTPTPQHHKFEIATSEIFLKEFCFWLSPKNYLYPKYSFQFAEELEDAIIQNFESNLPYKIKQTPEYDKYRHGISLFSSPSNKIESPFEIPAEERDSIPDDQYKIIQ